VVSRVAQHPVEGHFPVSGLEAALQRGLDPAWPNRRAIDASRVSFAASSRYSFDPSHVSGSALLNTSTWKAVLKTPGAASSAALAILEQVDDAVAGDSKVGWGADTDDERAHRGLRP